MAYCSIHWIYKSAGFAVSAVISYPYFIHYLRNGIIYNMIVYGIPNCDTVKKATVWLKENKLEYEFHDYKKAGITKSKLADWCKIVGWEVLLNKKSTTWKSLTQEEQQSATSQAAAIKIMFEHNSIIKRPVIEFGNELLVGFNESEYQKKLIPMK